MTLAVLVVACSVAHEVTTRKSGRGHGGESVFGADGGVPSQMPDAAFTPYDAGADAAAMHAMDASAPSGLDTLEAGGRSTPRDASVRTRVGPEDGGASDAALSATDIQTSDAGAPEDLAPLPEQAERTWLLAVAERGEEQAVRLLQIGDGQILENSLLSTPGRANAIAWSRESPDGWRALFIERPLDGVESTLVIVDMQTDPPLVSRMPRSDYEGQEASSGTWVESGWIDVTRSRRPSSDDDWESEHYFMHPDDPGQLYPYTVPDGRVRGLRFHPTGAAAVLAREDDRDVLYLGTAGSEGLVVSQAGEGPPSSGALPRWSTDGQWALLTWELDADGSQTPMTRVVLYPTLGNPEAPYEQILEGRWGPASDTTWAPTTEQVLVELDSDDGGFYTWLAPGQEPHVYQVDAGDRVFNPFWVDDDAFVFRAGLARVIDELWWAPAVAEPAPSPVAIVDPESAFEIVSSYRLGRSADELLVRAGSALGTHLYTLALPPNPGELQRLSAELNVVRTVFDEARMRVLFMAADGPGNTDQMPARLYAVSLDDRQLQRLAPNLGGRDRFCFNQPGPGVFTISIDEDWVDGPVRWYPDERVDESLELGSAFGDGFVIQTLYVAGLGSCAGMLW
jgi:hypothetical protein